MSSKTNKVAGASSSSEQQKREHDAPSTCKTSLTPKLRFPEFRDAAGWEESRLADICSKITQGGTPDTSEPKFWGGSINWMTPAEMGKTESPFIDATTRTITESGLDNCSSYLLPIYSVILSVRAPIGSLAINTTPMAINQGCKGLITGNTLSFSFLYYSLINSKARLIDLGAGNTFKELSGSALKSYEIGLPSPPEQQRIAECLSAVDEVIAAQARKLDALKSHKKGLMQELFPREGETLPKLRFPEFRDAGEWTTVTLGSVASISTEKVGDKTCIPMSITSGVGLVSQMEKFGRIIAGSSYKNYLLLKMNDFAYNKSATKEYPEGFIALYCGDEVAAVPNSIFTCFRIKSHLPSPQYLNYLFLGNLHGQWLRKFIEVGARAHGSLSIDEDDLLAMPVPLPKGESSLLEQQKIADCLTSLDDLITIQAQKLDALKTHKKGLMQQLFPSPEEVEV